ncbi:MAG: rod shape-determining protein MreD [Alphaproteobacteria bacterium]
MRLPLTQALDEWARKSAPFAVTVMLALLAVLRVPAPGFVDIAPMFPVMAVYYWSLYRPELLPPLPVFAIGLLVDSLSGVPLGVNALLLLAVCAFVRSQRQLLEPRGFILHWFAFLIVVALFEGLRWLLMSLVGGGIVGLAAPAYRAGLAVALYPILSWLLLRVHHAFLKQV